MSLLQLVKHLSVVNSEQAERVDITNQVIVVLIVNL
jgi:hypothetical protein